MSQCNNGFCHFKLVFFGSENSNVNWPAGFPIDTLVVAKSNCAKVTVTNPLFVASDTRIDSGQLSLYPNAGVPNKFVSGGNVIISQGGGLILHRDSLGNVANVAVRGTIIDQNPSGDSTCRGLSNPYGGLITFFIGTLPITLIDFSAKSLQQSVLLKWRMSNQQEAHVFGIEKSFDGTRFTKIGTVNASQTIAVYDYQFTDNGTTADIVYYRVKITNNDGKISYSKVIRVNETTSEISVYPNPVNDHFTIKNLPIASQINLSILDAKGAIIKKMSVYVTSSSLNIKTSDIPRGRYILLLRVANIIRTVKLIKL